MPDLSELTIREQRQVEYVFAYSVMIHPLEAVQECGWLDPAQLVDERMRRFWGDVRQLDTNGLDGEAAINAVNGLALSSGIMLDALGQSENLVGGSTPILYANEIARRGYMTQITAKMPEFIKALQARDDRAIRELIGRMGDVVSSAPAELPTLDRIAVEFMERVERGNLSIPTYIPNLDLATGGIERRGLTILAARPSMGKTALALQIARNAAEGGTRTIFYSLEMSQESLFARMACPLAGVVWRDVMSGNINQAQKSKLGEQALQLAERYRDHLYIVDGEQTMQSIWQQVGQYKPGLIMVDHLRLVSETGDNENQRLGKIARDCKRLAKAHDVAVMVLSQLNRGTEMRGKDDKRPQLSDLRESGQIEEEADAVWMIYRESYYSGVNLAKDPTEIWVRKFRNGVMNGRIDLIFDKVDEWFLPAERRQL